MDIQQTSTPTTTSGSTYSDNSSAGINDRFMTLLVAQLMNQDPTEPMDSSDLTAQLAQLASLEQAEMANQQLAILGQVVANVGNIASMGIVGKEARIAVDEFDWDASAGGTIDGSILTDGQNLDRDYKVVVKDENGNVVKTIDAELVNGELVYEWDGTNDDGNKVTSGKYEFEVGYEDAEGDYKVDSDAAATVTAKISSMQFFPTSVTGLSNGMSITNAMILAILDLEDGSGGSTEKPSNPIEKEKEPHV
ncbi:Flagellar basal-body rod modification protein FlgD [Vibrio chagasii]|nr:Flagellar basal-body rod modification protein FlgD [Vibrio chagasii]